MSGSRIRVHMPSALFAKGSIPQQVRCGGDERFDGGPVAMPAVTTTALPLIATPFR
jgi:hypothetical protein